MQSLFFPCMKERDKRGSARRVAVTRLDAKTEGKKVLLRKLASSIRDLCHGLWYRKSLFLVIVQLPRKRLVQGTYILKWHYIVERARSCNLSM